MIQADDELRVAQECIAQLERVLLTRSEPTHPLSTERSQRPF
jgi:hypothetical protein